MRLVFALAVLAGCGSPEPSDPSAPDPGTLAPLLAASRPEPLLDLVVDPREALGTELDCPFVEVTLEQQERWTGGCALSDGSTVEGTLTVYNGLEGAWVAADRFAIRLDGELLLYLDGALELVGEGDLVTLDAAASLCGFGSSCTEGLTTLDLSYSLFPLGSYPALYDATVTGAVAVDGGAATAVDGTWSIDASTCASEPVSGLFTLARGERHALELDGGQRCDGCAPWSVQGLQVGEYCGLKL